MSFLKRLFGAKKSRQPSCPQTKSADGKQSASVPRAVQDVPSVDDTRAAAAMMRPKLTERQVNTMSFTVGVKSIARQFSASGKYSSRDSWFASEAYCLLEFGEWAGLLSQSDHEIEPDTDLYYAGLLAGMVGQLPDDIIR